MSDFITEKEEIKNLIVGFPTVTMYRASFGQKRGYVLPEPVFSLYSGLTGALSAATFKGHMDNKRLEKWRDKQRAELGADNADAHLQAMADYGQLAHMAIVRIKENGKLVWKEEQDLATEFFVQSALNNNIPVSTNVVRTQVHEYCKTAASILQFVYDNVTEIHSVEGMCYSDELSIATPVDIVCTIKDKKGDFRVSINLKTSGQITHHHREQCTLEKFMWNGTYPDFKVTRTGILRGKDWSIKKGLPTYEWEMVDEQEEQEMLVDAVSRLKLAKANPQTTYMTYPKQVMVFEGETKLGEQPKLAYQSIEELWKALQENKAE